MSPGIGSSARFAAGVPRASGDEPVTPTKVSYKEMCSPRERG